MLKYYLESFQSIDKNSRSQARCVARAQGEKTVQGRALHQRLAMRAGLREHEVAAVLQALNDEVRANLREGTRVNLQGLAQFMPAITGTFRDYDSRRDPKRHKVKVGVRPSPKLNKDVNLQLRWQRVHRDDIRLRPNVMAVFNGRQEHVSTIKPGANVKIYGARLKFNETAPDEGVFLIPVVKPQAVMGASPPSVDDEVWPVDVSSLPEADDQSPGDIEALNSSPLPAIRMQEFVMNTPQWLIFQTPNDLPPGDYRLEVRSRLRDCTIVTRSTANHYLSVEATASSPPNQAVA